MIRTKNVVGAVIGVNLLAGLMSSAYAEPSADAEAVAHESWRDSIARNPAPLDGCFHASYPSMAWEKIECVAAPAQPYLPRSAVIDDTAETVGNGVDFVAEASSGLISQTVGTFPVVSGVTKETDSGKNAYSIQLNSNFMDTAVCAGKSKCMAWQQYVYASTEKSAFMQYWLINYGSTCPKGGWMAVYGDCYMNSKAVSVPKIAISKLSSMKMSATAVKGGKDTLVFTADSDAYSTSGEDSVTDLATGWTQSEFNIIGDGGGSEATFNTGSSLTVNIAITDGSSAAPTCGPKDGTTGETNNLKLGSCKASGGSTPSIEFTESN